MSTLLSHEETVLAANDRPRAIRGAAPRGAGTETQRGPSLRRPEGFVTDHPELGRVEPARAALSGAGWLSGVLLLAADQAVKCSARVSPPAGAEAVSAQNPGTLLGLLPGSPGDLVLAAAAVMVTLVVWQLVLLHSGRATRAGLLGSLLVLGGGASNLLDRVLLGGVTDCLTFFGVAFNLADLGILAGLLMLACEGEPRRRSAPATTRLAHGLT